MPTWFHDAKLGIFVHWGLYSVPGWAPVGGSREEAAAHGDWRAWFARNPYAEWYANSMRIPGSPTHQHHLATYGEGFAYDDFAPQFRAAIARWDPGGWADLFREAGARYAVFVTKHHDGFLMWPSRHPNPHKAGYGVERDLVGQLKAALEARGLRLGLYYSGGLDRTFEDRVISDLADLLCAIPRGEAYADYVTAHWRELIARYAPSILWNDIGYPPAADLKALLADYYHAVPDGAVNDRFGQYPPLDERLLKSPLALWLLGVMLEKLATSQALVKLLRLMGGHCDFRTPEYASLERIADFKWEATRGLGHSFGYNRNEGSEHLLTVRELVHLLADVVSKNGNLLLGVTPQADGTIPPIQQERLRGLGHWLATCGEAIFATRPWVRAEGRTADGIPVRFTRRGECLYAILLGEVESGGRVAITSLRADPAAVIHLLGHDEPLAWTQTRDGLTVALPGELPESPAYALRVAPAPIT